MDDLKDPSFEMARPTADSVLTLMRQLSHAELVTLMKHIPSVSTDLCPEAAVISRAIAKARIRKQRKEFDRWARRAMQIVRLLNAQIDNMSIKKPGPKKKVARIRILALAEVIHEEGRSWADIGKFIEIFSKQFLDGAYSTRNDLKIAVCKARKEAGFVKAKFWVYSHYFALSKIIHEQKSPTAFEEAFIP